MPSCFLFGRFIPIKRTPIINGIAGNIIAIFKNPISVKIPAIILPTKPPTAIELDSRPIAFGTSFGSLISRTRIYGAAVKAPCAAPRRSRKIINGISARTKPIPIPQTAQIVPEIITIFLLPSKSPSFPPMGVIIARPREEKMVSNEK